MIGRRTWCWPLGLAHSCYQVIYRGRPGGAPRENSGQLGTYRDTQEISKRSTWSTWAGLSVELNRRYILCPTSSLGRTCRQLLQIVSPSTFILDSRRDRYFSGSNVFILNIGLPPIFQICATSCHCCSIFKL